MLTLYLKEKISPDQQMESVKMKRRVNILLIVVVILLIILYYSHKNNNGFIKNKCLFGNNEFDENMPIIYAVTPTYARPVQKAELTRLAQTLMLSPYVHWILVEDSNTTSKLVEGILTKSKLIDRSTQLNIKTPDNYKLKNKDPNWSIPRGVEQRNLALSWIRDYYKTKQYRHALLYFMDDDNTYSLELFNEIAKINPGKVGVWPVGLVGGLMVEKPILDENNIVTGFNSMWRPERPFPIDMAGFAVSLDLLLANPEAKFSFEIPRGYQETEILRHVTVLSDVQPLANLCRDILVWHTRTESPKLDSEKKLKASGQVASNYRMEV